MRSPGSSSPRRGTAAIRLRPASTEQIADATTYTEAIVALAAQSREHVDELADKALEVGGSPANDATDHGFTYGRSFHDPDGHMWEVFWMDPSAIEQQESAATGTSPTT